MNIGINPIHFYKAAVWEENRTLTEILELVRLAGFRHLNINAASPKDAETIAAYVEQHGMQVTQSHMPFNRYDKKDAEVFMNTVMTYANHAKMMGAGILVVHADEFDYANRPYTGRAALEYNYQTFYNLVDFAEKNGMRVAFENTFQEAGMVTQPHFCSLVDDLLALVDRYHTDAVGICWDTGHAKMQYKNKDMAALKEVIDRVICTHIHDNYYEKDLHCFPCMGTVQWKELMEILRNANYQGDFSFELVYDRLPKALAPDYLKLLYRTGEYLINEL